MIIYNHPIEKGKTMCRHCDNDTSADTSISYPTMDNPYGDKGVLIYFGVTHSRHGWYLEVATNKVVNETVPLFGGHLNMLVTKPVFIDTKVDYCPWCGRRLT